MEDVVAALDAATRNAEAVGRLVCGIGMLKTRYGVLWLAVEGQAPIEVPAADVGFGDGSLTIGGCIVAPFADISRWDVDSGEPCVAFRMMGRQALFAPATVPGDDRFIREIDRFLSTNWYDDDDVFLSGIDGGLGAGAQADAKLGVRRPVGVVPGEDPLAFVADDELVVHGETIRLGDVTWFDVEHDGDGNRHAHFVTVDGRYRRLSLGDLGR